MAWLRATPAWRWTRLGKAARSRRPEAKTGAGDALSRGGRAGPRSRPGRGIADRGGRGRIRGGERSSSGASIRARRRESKARRGVRAGSSRPRRGRSRGAASGRHVYLRGRRSPKELATGVEWIEKAALNDHGPSQFQLAVQYSTGLGVAEDLEQAVYWYRQAAQRGEPYAQYNTRRSCSRRGRAARPIRTRRWSGARRRPTRTCGKPSRRSPR